MAQVPAMTTMFKLPRAVAAMRLQEGVHQSLGARTHGETHGKPIENP